MSIQLELKHLQLVKAIFKQHLPHHQVLVFGSRITQKVKPHSDLDLCIVGSESLSFTQLAKLRELFAESDLPMRVDLVDWTTLSPQFQEIIKQKSVKLC